MNERDSRLFEDGTLDRHRRGLGLLARRLVGDAAAAEDLVQSTFVRALEHPPDEGRGIGAWLRAVLRNEARQSVRTDRRREARERIVANESGSAVASDAAGTMARFDAQLRLMNAVGELAAPHREVILLRFFEDLPPRKIAARLAIPVKSVESRIQRAIASLRTELDVAHDGDRRAWLAALVPLCPPRVPLLPARAFVHSILGALTVKTVVVTGIAVLGLVVALLWNQRSDDGSAADSSRVSEAPVNAIALEAPKVDDSKPAVRDVVSGERVATGALMGKSETDVESGVFEQPGRLMDPEGLPLAGVHLRAVGRDALAQPIDVTTDAAGRFVLRGWGRSHALESRDDRFMLLGDVEYSVDVPDSADRGAKEVEEIVVLGAPVTRFRARVVDETDRPLEGADLELAPSERVRVLLGTDAARTRLKRFEGRSDRDGWFDVERVPAMRGLIATASKPGFDPATLEFDAMVTATANAEPKFVLRRRATAVAQLEGVVRDAHGAGFAGVRVGFGGQPATTDAEGRFHFEYDAASPPDRLLAVAKGFLPASLERQPAAPAWPPFVELRIAEAPRVIAGVVLDEHGATLAGAAVWIAESTALASWDQGLWTAENTIRGGGPLRILAMADDAGRFRIEGLLDREYGLLALDFHRAWIVGGGKARGGDENVVIRFPLSELRTIEGRVVDHRGVGVASAAVMVECRMLAAQDASGLKFYDTALGSSTTTDADGAFVLADVPSRDASLRVNRDDLLDDTQFAIPERSSIQPLVLTVSLRCEVRVESDAAEFALEDADGRVMSLFRNDLAAVSSIERAKLFDGRSEVVAASDAARWLLLYDASGNATRREVRLVPGQLNVLK